MPRIPGPEQFGAGTQITGGAGAPSQFSTEAAKDIASSVKSLASTAVRYQRQQDKNEASRALLEAQAELDKVVFEATSGDYTKAVGAYDKGADRVVQSTRQKLGSRVFPLIADRLGLARHKAQMEVAKFYRKRVRELGEAAFHNDMASIRKDAGALSGPNAGLEYRLYMDEARDIAAHDVASGAVKAEAARKALDNLEVDTTKDILGAALRGRIQGGDGYYATIKALESGKFDDPFLKSRWDALDQDEKDRVIRSVITEARQMKQFERDREHEQEKVLEDARRRKWSEFYKAVDDNDVPKQRAILRDLDRLEEDPHAIRQKGHTITSRGGDGAGPFGGYFGAYAVEDQAGVEEEARRRLLNGDIGRRDLQQYRGYLTPPTFSKLEGYADQVQRRVIGDSMREIGRALGLPPNVQFTGDSEDELFRLSTKVNRAQSQLQRFIEQKPEASSDEIQAKRDEIIDAAKGIVTDEMAKEARQILERRCSQIRGCDINNPAASLQDLIAKNQVAREMIPGVMRAIKEAERRGVLKPQGQPR